ncbi:MAG: hypothetical protein HYX68_13040 [Planctomycetes bacterium]|jgi:hypothetical protein|nr:hypothetical protein [Planctomycetota bacterium]
MIYSNPKIDEPLDQGDLLDDCPMVTVAEHAPDRLEQAQLDFRRGIILTQTCDISNDKVDRFIVAEVFDVQTLRSADKRRARLLTPYREHLAKHFADTYSRIGLPQPYETI